MIVWCKRECIYNKDGKCARDNIIISAIDGACQGCKIPCRNFMRDDNTVVFDEAGIPSIMVKFTRPEDGSEDELFTACGCLYDELYISKYKNCEINGKPYSLPGMKPWTNITLDDAEKVCFEKGEGWHLMTAAEHGFLARMSLKNGTLPHGNTRRGKYHANENEKCQLFNDCQMLTGSGSETWYHDHTIFGIDGLCGDTWEWLRGLRLMNGQLQYVPNNDAAANIDLSKNSTNWIPMKYGEEIIYLSCDNEAVRIDDEQPEKSYDGSEWGEVENVFAKIPPEMQRLGLFGGDPKNYIFVDTEGERLPLCGGDWDSASYAGVFIVYLGNARSYSGSYIGFHSAFLKKKVTDKPETE